MERPTPFAPWYSTGVNQLARAGADVPYLGASGAHLSEHYLPVVRKTSLETPIPFPPTEFRPCVGIAMPVSV
jgi:hypothetical protein